MQGRVVNGAELLVKTAQARGIEVCFANAGTTEIPIVMALDAAKGIRAILGLFEGVCTGAADGYGRMMGRPAMALLHLGPGFANGIANLHDARRAATPLLNVIGQHATWHLPADPPLAMDVESLTRTVSSWVRTNESVERLSRDMSDAINASLFGQISSLIVPHDLQMAEARDAGVGSVDFAFDSIDADLIKKAAQRVRAARKSAFLLDGRALSRPGLEAASRIRAKLKSDLFAPTFFSCVERGVGLPDVQRIPYFPEEAISLLSGYDLVVIVSAHEPVTFFGYPGIRGHVLSDEQEKVYLCGKRNDPVEALEALGDELGAPARSIMRDVQGPRAQLPSGELTAEKACLTIAALQPEHAIIVDEGITSGFTYYPLTASSPPHTFMTIAGGSIGYGMPCATGAAVACPDRPVINFQADGSALYTVQALWTQAREGLHAITLICSNRSYKILQLELSRAGITSYGDNARALTELNAPPINWVSLARGFGVPAASVDSVEGLARELRIGLAEPGPLLIEMLLA
jgi:acetolactate synthase I/II/III large subunit